MPLPRRTVTRATTVVGFVAALVMGLLIASWTQGDTTTYPRWEPPAAQSSSDTGQAPPGSTVDPESGLPIILLSDLPAEAQATVDRIVDGGPFPFPEHDGGIFQNREGLLPDRPEGHYREYTVGGRPGDRGPLRIVAGEDLDYYWTDDHYQSFSLVVNG